MKNILSDKKLDKIQNKYIRLNLRFNIKSFSMITAGIILAASLSFYGVYKAEHRKISEVPDITTNAAEEYYYNGNYSKALEEYESFRQREEDNPLWPIKIAEIYSIQGDIENSNKYLEMAKKIREENTSSVLTEFDEDFEKKDAEAANYIVFTEFMNKDYKEAEQYGDIVLSKYHNKQIIKTMISVYMANGNIEKAKNLIDNYPVDKSSANDVAELAYLNMLIDNWDGGFKLLKDAWYLDKDEYKIFDILAQVSVYNKDELLEKISSLSEKEPNEASYKMWLAKIYSMREETTEMAQGLLDEISKNDIGKFEKVLIQSAIYQNSKQMDKASNLIDTMIQENKNDYRILHTAGWFYFEKGYYNKAIEYCKQSILKNKNYADNYGFLMTEILKAMGKGKEGEPYFRTALYIEPYNYHIMSTIANYYWYTTKDVNKALEYFKFAEILKPKDTGIKYNMALINITNNDFDTAIENLNKCIEIDTSIPKYHRTLGTIYMQQGKYDLAIKEIRNSYEADKNDVLSLNNAGCYYIMVEGDITKGRYNIEKAFEGINDSMDNYTKETIQSNYKKANEIYEKYTKGNDNDIIVPEFVLFY